MKRPIDLQREGAGFMNVGSPEDSSPITSMVVIGKTMYVVKTNSIYEVRMADEIDPERTNASIPNTQQEVLGVGSDSEIVGRILLTANVLLNKNYLPASIDCEGALRFCFDALKDMAAMGEIAETLEKDEQDSIARLGDNRKIDRSVLLPSIKNLTHRCNEFLQKADHSLGRLYSIVGIFYPRARKPYFDGFSDTLVALYGATDPFAQGVRNVLPFLKFVRDARNSVEHPKPNQKIIVKDFTFDPSGRIIAPTIEVVHARSPQAPVSISVLMRETHAAIIDVFESMIAGLCSKNIKNDSGFVFEVIALPAGSRRDKFVSYSYGLVDQNGEIIPSS
jgi:hypothetical protein